MASHMVMIFYFIALTAKDWLKKKQFNLRFICFKCYGNYMP